VKDYEQDKPLVSIVIPVKNGMPYLKKCIESVSRQAISNLEVIISDDHSTDGSREFLATLNPDIFKVITPLHPMSIGEHWTFVTSQAQGQYIKLLCSDDEILLGGLHHQVVALDENPSVQFVASKRNIITASGKVLIRNFGVGNSSGIKNGMEVLKKSFLSGTNIIGEPSAVLFRRTTLQENLPWNDSRPYLLDFEMYARILIQSNSNIALLDTTDATFRLHGESLSNRIQTEHIQDFKQKMKEYSHLLDFNKAKVLSINTKIIIKTLLRQLMFWLAKKIG
jgi:glycosyltransferase involved in cell wall biosynthesis